MAKKSDEDERKADDKKPSLSPPQPPPPPPPTLHPPKAPVQISSEGTRSSVSAAHKMPMPPKRRVAKVYLDSFHYTFYEVEARKRNMSLSELFKAAIYDFIFKAPIPLSPQDVPILKMIPRIDRTPKGPPIRTSATVKPQELHTKLKANRGEFGEVLDELKGFDFSKLKKVDQSDLVNPPSRHKNTRLDDKESEVAYGEGD